MDGREPPIIEEEQSGHSRSKRLEEQRRAHEHLVNYALMTKVIHAEEPKCFIEAEGDDRWMETMQSKYGSIMKNNTWDLVDQSPKHKVIDTKWVYKIKYKFKNTLDKYKALLMAKGFAQVHGFDYHYTFALTPHITTIRSVLALAA